MCPTNANLLASGGSDKSIKIYDRRESQIIKTYDGIHHGKHSRSTLYKVLFFIEKFKFSLRVIYDV